MLKSVSIPNMYLLVEEGGGLASRGSLRRGREDKSNTRMKIRFA
jgi:hypothetical protein